MKLMIPFAFMALVLSSPKSVAHPTCSSINKSLAIQRALSVPPPLQSFNGDAKVFNSLAMNAGMSRLVPIAGVFKSTAGFAADMFEFDAVPQPDGLVCVFPRAIRLRFFVEGALFLFDPAVERNACLYSVTRAHLQRKAESQENTLREFEPRFVADLTTSLDVPMRSFNNQAEGELFIEGIVQRSLERTRKAMEQTIDQRSRAIDTPEELTTLHSCWSKL